jgi:hypothetical protein
LLASNFAVASPIPDDAPVIITTLSSITLFLLIRVATKSDEPKADFAPEHRGDLLRLVSILGAPGRGALP